MTEVVVTGRGVVSSIGEGADAFFEALLAKRSGIADGIGACVDFDPEVAMTPKEARRSDRYTQLAVAAADAGGRGGRAARRRRPRAPRRARGHRRRRPADAAERVPGLARGRRPRRLPALRADDDAQRRRRHDRDAPRRPRPGLQRLERVRHGRPRDRRGHADDRPRRGRRRRRRRDRGRAHRAVPRRLQAHGRALARGRLAPVRRRGATASSWARAPACSCSSARSTRKARGADDPRAHRRLRRLQRRLPHHACPTRTAAARRRRCAPRWPTPARRRATWATSTPTAPRRRSTTRSRRSRSSRCSTARRRRRRCPRRSRAIGHLLGAAGAVEAIVVHRSACAAACCPRRSTTRSPTRSATSTTCPRGPREAPGLELALSNSFGFGGQNACLALAAHEP